MDYKKYRKILFVSSFTPPLNAGSGRNAYNFAKYISEEGIDVTLLSLNRKGQLKTKEHEDNLKIIRLRYYNQNLITKILSLIIILPGYFFRVIKNDVIFVYGGNIIAFEFILLFGRILGKKVVFRSTMYGEDDIKTLVSQRWVGKFNRFCLKGLSLYFSINSAFTISWERTFGSLEKVFESVQGVDTNLFFPVEKEVKFRLREELNLPVDVLIIVSVGYLVDRKGYRFIFEALSRLDFPFLYLVIGDYQVSNYHYLKSFNQEMTDLFQLGSDLLGDKVLFTGDKDNIDEYLNASDIFILNSFREGFPNVVLESMASGLPVVVRDIEGIEVFFLKRNKNIIINSGESVEIMENMRKLFFDSDLRERIGKEASLVIKEQASFDILWNKLKIRLRIQSE